MKAGDWMTQEYAGTLGTALCVQFSLSESVSRQIIDLGCVAVDGRQVVDHRELVRRESKVRVAQTWATDAREWIVE